MHWALRSVRCLAKTVVKFPAETPAENAPSCYFSLSTAPLWDWDSEFRPSLADIINKISKFGDEEYEGIRCRELKDVNEAGYFLFSSSDAFAVGRIV